MEQDVREQKNRRKKNLDRKRQNKEKLDRHCNKQQDELNPIDLHLTRENRIFFTKIVSHHSIVSLPTTYLLVLF